MRRPSFLLAPVYLSVALLGATASALTSAPHISPADAAGQPVRARWEARLDRPVRVYIKPGAGLRGWTPENARLVWSAFGRWYAAEVPVRFVRVRSASSADVVVEWVEGLQGNCIGKTWREHRGDAITTGRITLALHDHRKHPLSLEVQRGAVLHEIGHLLGLDHVAERASIMYPQVWVTDLAEGDRAALRTLYDVQPRRDAD